jgi:hypothetical protein
MAIEAAIPVATAGGILTAGAHDFKVFYIRGAGFELAPELPVQDAVIHSFVDVLRQDVCLVVEIRDRAGDAEDLVMGPSREPHFLNARTEKVRAGVA